MRAHSSVRSRRALIGTLSFAICIGGVHAQTPTNFEGGISTTFGPVMDNCAFEFSLFDATAGGTQIGPVIERELPVRGGRYEVELDFGPEATDGGSRYLEVAVGCPAGTADLTTLTRRVFVPGATVRSGQANRVTPASQDLGAQPKAALGTGFTYQGELKQSGSPVTGLGDFQFSLWDALQGGNQIGASVPAGAVGVEDGRFTVQLDFGAAAFDGDARWLQIAVDYPSGTGSFTTLSPRQPLSAAPYALQTRGIFVDDINRVGIGTDTPVHPLHVVGSAMVDGDLHIDSGHDIEISDPSNRIYEDLGNLRLESGSDVRINPSDELRVDGTTLVVDSGTNRVGIGTSMPASPLHVDGNALFDGDLTVSTGHRFGLGTTSPDEMLHVENTAASGLAFLKLQTSHPSDWGETGIRFETPQNRWHLRMDDYDNGNIPEGALGLRCNTPGHEIMTWTEAGTVGIGNTNPSAKLDVVGDLELSGAYRGHIGPNNGAPFPRPAYDSGWVAIEPGTNVRLIHGISGDRDDYVVDMQMKHALLNYPHNKFFGGLVDSFGEQKGAYWDILTSDSIRIYRQGDDYSSDLVRIRIWVVN